MNHHLSEQAIAFVGLKDALELPDTHTHTPTQFHARLGSTVAWNAFILEKAPSASPPIGAPFPLPFLASHFTL